MTEEQRLQKAVRELAKVEIIRDSINAKEPITKTVLRLREAGLYSPKTVSVDIQCSITRWIKKNIPGHYSR